MTFDAALAAFRASFVTRLQELPSDEGSAVHDSFDRRSVAWIARGQERDWRTWRRVRAALLVGVAFAPTWKWTT